MEKALLEILQNAVKGLLQTGVGPIDIEVPKDEGFGDLSTPVAMVLAKPLKKPPRKIAEEIVHHIDYGDRFERIDIAGPGFINFTFTRDFICRELSQLLTERDAFLTEDVGYGRKVQIEFVSANPTGPLHLGHGRRGGP